MAVLNRNVSRRSSFWMNQSVDRFYERRRRRYAYRDKDGTRPLPRREPEPSVRSRAVELNDSGFNGSYRRKVRPVHARMNLLKRESGSRKHIAFVRLNDVFVHQGLNAQVFFFFPKGSGMKTADDKIHVRRIDFRNRFGLNGCKTRDDVHRMTRLYGKFHNDSEFGNSDSGHVRIVDERYADTGSRLSRGLIRNDDRQSGNSYGRFLLIHRKRLGKAGLKRPVFFVIWHSH